MVNKIITVATVLIFVLVSMPVLAFSQDDLKQRAIRIVDKLTSKVGVPEPIEINIYSKLNIGDLAHFSAPKERPTLNINGWFFANLSDKALTYVLAHELGHYFDSKLHLILSQIGFELNGQFMADTFALYVLGEDLFRAGRNEMTLMYYYNVDSTEKWLMENDPTYYNLQLNYVHQRTEWWLIKAKQNLDQVPSLILHRNSYPINSAFKSTR